MRSIIDPPPASAIARFHPGFGQRFLLTAEVAEHPGANEPRNAAAHHQWIAAFQALCENEGVAPVYLLDGPGTRSEAIANILRPPLAAGKAEAGVLLQPDVPDGAPVSRLRDSMEENFNVLPVVYRASRRSTEAEMMSFLSGGGAFIDSSVRARFDCSTWGGPDYSRHPPLPYWLDDEHRLLELPLTAAFWGLLRRQGEWLYPALDGLPAFRAWLARTSLLERIALTPEGASVEEAIRVIDVTLDDGVPLLVFSFNGASLHAAYGASRDEFYDWWRRVFAYLELRGIAPASVAQIKEAVLR